ncbi:IS110 family transposase [Methylobacterium nodulans]|uniref:Transposase IS116/IS110/IS902 family protein n=1 Tax=Methylobacterium nodulans (strain LMG 21967 / CNCM I-2342 / ORS 2060) TaxID=460265 RepID=B8IC09_METNO|nr:IS110 family transposase [Methylobacterium nodulans]ACL61191.1 transposase IS116/IS110/IS902 family protein [Methylobacterium nodulans ORS 2060]
MVLLGMDVAKASLDCAVLTSVGDKLVGRRSFPNSPEGADRVARWVAQVSGAEAADTHLIVEATAAYHTAAYHEVAAQRLAAAGLRVSIVNSARVRSFAKALGILGKTDRIDAHLLARYGLLVRPKLWSPPAKALLDLQSLIARLDDLEADLRREENRLEQARTRGCPDLVERSLLTSIAELKAQAAEIKQGIAAHIAADADLQSGLERLMTIPAVGPKTATRMLLMLRMRAFDSARQAAAFLGLVPVERTSGTSVRGRPSLSRAGNPRLRAALYMAAVVGTRKNPDIKAQYEHLLGRGKCKMAALGAAMRKLVHLCFGVLKDEGGYRPGAASKP